MQRDKRQSSSANIFGLKYLEFSGCMYTAPKMKHGVKSNLKVKKQSLNDALNTFLIMSFFKYAAIPP